ncbi:hypothetical protein ElyMa_000698300 [Elysia marginata]|uniref:Reverse transcriptase domain-containing protein n=1 Tax=Elysia marginata TaxID=1093978 RepID=A0AAV4GII6_9GAST|nr:hypothetical protein ElyMa_000698300 [Elysia marginata]
MGTKMGRNYACLFMGYLEWQMVNRYQGPTPEFYYRYIDDGIGVSTMPLDDLENYIDFVKTFHPSISFTSEILQSTISVFFKLTPMLVRFLMSLLLLCIEERKTFATYWFAVVSLRLITQEPDLAGDLGVKLVLMCHNLVKSTRLAVSSRLLTHLPALVAT